MLAAEGAQQPQRSASSTTAVSNKPTTSNDNKQVDDIKLAGKKQNTNPMWKELNKEVDLGEPTSFLDHVHLGCTQR